MNFRRKKSQSGFTLIELLVVIIIATILAAVGVPLLTGNVERAITTEASAGLSMIRTGMRAWFAEHNTYLDPDDPDAVPGPTFAQLGIDEGDAAADPPVPGDLNGRYFVTGAYSIADAAATTFCAAVEGDDADNIADPPAGAPRSGDVALIERSMNQDGTIFDDKACAGNELN